MVNKKKAKAKQKQEDGPGKNRSLRSILILAGLVIIYLFTTKKEQSISKFTAAQPRSEQISFSANKTPVAEEQKRQIEMSNRRSQWVAAQTIGLRNLPISGKGATISIPFIFRPKKQWCVAGDLDTMKYASTSLSQREFIVSLELIGKASDKNPLKRASIEEFFVGFESNFSIPRPKEGGGANYGLYICSDKKNQNNCQGKVAMSHADLNEALAAKNSREKDEDHIFYFQNIIVTENSVQTYKNDVFHDRYKASVEKFVLHRHKLNQEHFEKSWQLNAMMKSVPSQIFEGKIILSLPHNDERCFDSMTQSKFQTQ